MPATANVLIIADFEHKDSIDRVRLANPMQDRIVLDSEYAAQGKYALRFSTPAYVVGMPQWPVLQFWAEETFCHSDWSAYDYFSFDLVNAGSEPLQLHLCISSTDTHQDGYRTDINLEPWGYHPIDIPVGDIAAGMQGGKPGKPVDITAVKLIHCYLTRPVADVHLHFDCFCLVKGHPDHRQAQERLTPKLAARILNRDGIKESIRLIAKIQAQLGCVDSERQGRTYVLNQAACLKAKLDQIDRRSRDERLSLAQARELAQAARENARAVRRLALFAQAWQARPAARFGVGVVDSMDFAYPRDVPFACLFEGAAQLALAKGEYESLQIAVFAYDLDLPQVSVRVGSLTGPDGRIVGRDDESIRIRIDPVGFLAVKPSIFYKTDYIGWIPDPLLAHKPAVDVPNDTIQPFWVEAYAAPHALPGTYKAKLEIRIAGVVEETIPLALEVWPFTISDRPHLPTAITFNGPLLDLVYGAEKAEQLRPMYIDFLRRFKIMPDHIYRRTPPTVAELQDLAERDALGLFNIMYVGLHDFDRQQEDTWPTAVERIKQLVSAAMEQYRAAGLDKSAYLYCFDEVESDAFPMVKEVLAQLKAAFPDLPIMTTLRDPHYGSRNGFDALIDIWTPSLLTYNPELAMQARAKGNKVWWYTYCSVTHPYPNWFNEYPPLDTRMLMGPMAYKFQTDGFLYYAINRWQGRGVLDDGPYSKWDPSTYKDANGDGSLFYPGPDGPLASIRLQNYRDGMEDYNLLVELRQRLDKAADKCGDPQWRQAVTAAEAALAVPDDIVTSLTCYTKDARVYRQWRNSVAHAIMALDSLINADNAAHKH
ncbi:MAG: glycoside hydrolase domain-containing protein [Limnochordia bacterium]